MSKPVDSYTFDKVVDSSPVPVLVSFEANWCGPCRALGPVAERISEEMADRMAFYRCDVDDNPELTVRFHIVSIPTPILFKDGKPVHTLVGNMPESALREELEACL